MQTLNFEQNVLGSTKYIRNDPNQSHPSLLNNQALPQGNSTSAFLSELAKTTHYFSKTNDKPSATSIINLTDFNLLSEDQPLKLQPREPMMIKSIQNKSAIINYNQEFDIQKKIKALQIKHIQSMAGSNVSGPNDRNQMSKSFYKLNIDMNKFRIECKRDNVKGNSVEPKKASNQGTNNHRINLPLNNEIIEKMQNQRQFIQEKQQQYIKQNLNQTQDQIKSKTQQIQKKLGKNHSLLQTTYLPTQKIVQSIISGNMDIILDYSSSSVPKSQSNSQFFQTAIKFAPPLQNNQQNSRNLSDLLRQTQTNQFQTLQQKDNNTMFYQTQSNFNQESKNTTLQQTSSMRMIQQKTQGISKFLRKSIPARQAQSNNTSYLNADLEPPPTQQTKKPLLVPDLSQFSSERSSKLNFVNTSKKYQHRLQKFSKERSGQHIIEIEQFDEDDLCEVRKSMQRGSYIQNKAEVNRQIPRYGEQQ
ncbi:hypothetical protein FGO68_gene16192 [Halteria grandinella]|uniref:Uncharacterized protein n=1 Tax=Halteria grandinella TaxID=5974 RepID=A0A8J8P2J6_HALGN|nr:hypothetical protein FGO68_gene16192 [Halteria grandinella]